MGMFDLQPSQSDQGAQLNQQQLSQQTQGQDPQASYANPVTGGTNFDALNQHVLLGVQAVGRLKSALLVRNS